METWKIQADYEELMMEKYKQSLHIMTISFLPSYQYFETFYFLQESKWLSSNMLDYFKTWYYCLQHNICYWNQRHVWVRKFLNYSKFYWNTPKTSIYQVSKKQQHSQSVTIFMILKLTDYMKYYYATHSYKVLQTIFPRRRLCRRTKPTSEENSASSSATNLSTAFVVR